MDNMVMRLLLALVFAGPAMALVVTAVTVNVVTRGVAYAGPEEDRQRAEKLIQEGLNLARSKQFRDAIPKFEAALKLYPHAETMHNLGRAHEELGELIQAYGYFAKALQQDYTFAADGRVRLARIEGELRKSYARVTFRTTPSQVNVVLTLPSGAEENHTSSPFQVWIPAGRTKVVGTNPSFKTGERNLDLAAGEDREVSIDLVPLLKKGFLQVSVNVPGAQISLAGESVGLSPLPGTAWDVGAYELEVKLKGFITQREQLVIAQDQVTSVNVTLVREKGESNGNGEVDAGVPSWIGWSLVGTGVVAGGIAAYLQFAKALPLGDDADAVEKTGATPEEQKALDAEYRRLHAKAVSFETAAILTGATGLAIAGVGVYLLVAEGGDEASAALPSFVPSVAFTADGGFVSGLFRF